MKSKIPKIVIVVSLIITLIILYFIRYYNLNHTLSVPWCYPKSIYDKNEFVEFEDNVCYGGVMNEGLKIEVLDSEIYNVDYFLNSNNINPENLYYMLPDKALEVKIRIKNISTENKAIKINNFEIVGSDWYTRMNTELTMYTNPFFLEHNMRNDLGVTLLPNDYYDLSLIYNIFEIFFSKKKFQNIEKEPMYMELTIFPENKFICFR